MRNNKIRKIAKKEHNIFIREGIEAHKSTSIVPPDLVQPISNELQEQLNRRYEDVDKILKKFLGEPYYSDYGFILYNGDCCEYLERLRMIDIKINLTLTSPPYNIGKEYENNLTVDQYINWCKKWMHLIYDATSSTGSFWLNLGYLDVPDKGLCVPIPYLLWDKTAFYLLQEVVWNYGAGVNTKLRLSPRNEKWLYYVKNNKDYIFNLDEIRDPNVKYPNQKKNNKFRCNPLGKNPSDVWQIAKVTTGNRRSSKERTDHPAQFPLGLVQRIIKASSNKTDVILDPFAGSCSTGIAAVGLGRVFIGFEVNSNYCSMAVERFEQYREEVNIINRQGRMF